MIQGFQVFVIPLVVVVLEIIFLIVSAEKLYNTIYYKFIIVDVTINIVGGWTYLGQLQRIQFEQEELSLTYYKLDEREQAQKDHALISNKTGAAIERERLDIGADYYSLVFCSYIKYYRKKYMITKE